MLFSICSHSRFSLVNLWVQVVSLCGQFLVSTTGDDTLPFHRVYVQNVSRVYQQHAHMLKHVCAWCRYTRGRMERTHRDVLSGHRGFFSVSHHTQYTAHTPQHRTQHTTTHNNTPRHTAPRHTTAHHNNMTTTQHGDRDRERQRGKAEKERERREDERGETRQEKTDEKTRQDEREEKIKRSREDEREEEREEDTRREGRRDEERQRREMKERMILLKKCLKPKNPPHKLAQNVSKKFLSDELFLIFRSKGQNLTVFSHIYMIGIRFSGQVN